MEERVTFESGVVTLEGLMNRREGGSAAVVCHPHPLYGGEMHNNVVQALVDELSQRGLSTLRFNFRGTGGSGGTHGGGRPEEVDVRSAVSFLVKEAGVSRIAVAGYSFGAHVGLRAGMQDDRVEVLACVALPIAMMDPTYVEECTKPLVLVAGDRDEFCPLTRLRELYETIPGPKELHVLEGVDHFYIGRDSDAARLVGEWIEAS
jgi:alpha/beta superfamily hydrolase